MCGIGGFNTVLKQKRVVLMEQVIRKLMNQKKSWDYVKQFRNLEGTQLDYVEWEDDSVSIEVTIRGQKEFSLPMQSKTQAKTMYGLYKKLLLGESL
jgi:hypothetical protein